MNDDIPTRYAALAGYLGRNAGDPVRSADCASLPLADEAHVAYWSHLVHEADAEGGAAVVLQARIAPLAFPVEAGIGASEAYRAATRTLEGTRPSPPAFVDPAGIRLLLHATAAGRLPVIVARARDDFVYLVRALGARNEPVAVPPSMGACIVGGLLNVDRIRMHRAAYTAAGGDDWQAEYRRYTADKANYQDRVVILSEGPYAGVPAGELGMTDADWLRCSQPLRLVHECTHYLTARVLGSMRNNLLDELAADFAGLLAATGAYDPAQAARLLGVDRDVPRDDARLHLYLGDPPLAGDALPALAALAREAIDALARFAREETPAARPFGVEHAVLALFDAPLWALSTEAGHARFVAAWRSLQRAAPVRSTEADPDAA